MAHPNTFSHPSGLEEVKPATTLLQHPGAYSYAPGYGQPYLPQGVTPAQQAPVTSSQYIGSTPVQVATHQPVKGESRIEYVPYEKSVLEYEAVQRTEYVPREKKVVDHYAVEHQVEYHPQVFHDRYVEYIPQERVVERVEYTPVERQVVHHSQPEVVQQEVPVQQYVQPQYVQQQYVQPQYVQPQYIQPQYVQPQYVQPQYIQHELPVQSVPVQHVVQSLPVQHYPVQHVPLTQSYIPATTHSYGTVPLPTSPTRLVQQPHSQTAHPRTQEQNEPGFLDMLFGHHPNQQ